MAHIIQIVPRLPPAVDGVGDYALNLARQLYKDFEIRTHFIIGDNTWTGVEQIREFQVSKLARRSSDGLFALLSKGPQSFVPVLLHYVGYGYEKRGCPVWLVDGLERWRTHTASTRLVTMFHEIYASGPPWTSSFWLSLLQKNLATRLVRLSDDCITSRQRHAEILYGLSQGRHAKIDTLPVFSNVGEPDQSPPPLAERARRLIVFGNRGNRRRVYERSLAALERTCQALRIEEILDIGPPTGLAISQAGSIPVVQMGPKTASEVSALLSDSIAGYFNYPTDFLAKSTIFAAYCAHRVIPVGSFYEARQADGLEAGKHYWLADSHGSLDLAQGQVMADNAYAWYQTHGLSAQAEIFAAFLTNSACRSLLSKNTP